MVSRDGQIGIYDLPDVLRQVVDREQAEADADGEPARGGRTESVFGRIRVPQDVRPLEELEVFYMRKVLGVCGGECQSGCQIDGSFSSNDVPKNSGLRADQGVEEFQSLTQ